MSATAAAVVKAAIAALSDENTRKKQDLICKSRFFLNKSGEVTKTGQYR